MTKQEIPPAGQPAQEKTSDLSAVELIKSIPSFAGLPGPVAAVIGLGIVAFAAMILLEALSLVLSIVCILSTHSVRYQRTILCEKIR